MATVKEMLDIMNLTTYTRIIVLEKRLSGFDSIGGGFSDDVICRFGNREIIKTSAVMSDLYVFVEL